MIKPNPKFFRQKIQSEIVHERIKAAMRFHFSAVAVLLAQLALGKSTFANTFIGIMVALFPVGLAILLRSYHPQILKFFYNIVFGIYGPIISFHNYEGVHRAWMGVQFFPMIVLFCTGSAWHFLFQTLAQLTYLHYLYRPKMTESLSYMSPQAITNSFAASSTSMVVVGIVIILCIFSYLERAYDRVTIAEAKKDEFDKQKIFLLSFSHELRNLLNSLMGHIRLASLESISEKVKDFLQTADTCGELLLHLINNILDSGKVEIGDLEINPVVTNIYETIERFWSVCSEIIKRKNLQGRLRIRNNLPEFLYIDHYRLMQIFLNLIGNAVKFTDKGMISITIEWISNTDQVDQKSFEPRPFDDENDLSEGLFEKEQMFSFFDKSYINLTNGNGKINRSLLNYTSCVNKGLLKVTVHDSGHGIPKEDITKLFQKFGQVSCDSAQRQLGTGLGLFITKELCTRMNGEIRAYSKKGQGSCFIFCIPSSPVQRDSIHSLQTQQNNQCQIKHDNMKVMIVDDELLSRNILTRFFNKLEIEVTGTAENGLDAFQKYISLQNNRDNRLLVVTMDLTMPIMDGKEAAHKIREYEREHKIRPCLMIIISGNCSESEIIECTDRNGKIKADAFLKKPTRIDDISQTILQYVRHNSSIPW